MKKKIIDKNNIECESDNKTDFYSDAYETETVPRQQYDTAITVLLIIMLSMLVLFLGVRYINYKSQSEIKVYMALTYADNETITQGVNIELNSININTANSERLCLLPSIGEVRAKAIIDYRNENGNFETIEEILNVPGIGDVIFSKLKEYITV